MFAAELRRFGNDYSRHVSGVRTSKFFSLPKNLRFRPSFFRSFCIPSLFDFREMEAGDVDFMHFLFLTNYFICSDPMAAVSSFYSSLLSSSAA